jgi:heme acquisition protein HasA
MTISIKYGIPFAHFTITDYIKTWVEENGNINTATTKDRGEFAGGGLFKGTQYAMGSSHGESTGMIAEGTLEYSFQQHILHGRIDSLELGKDLTVNQNGIGKQLDLPQLKLNGLNMASDISTGIAGEVHKSISGLQQGEAEPILAVLQAKGVDVNVALKDMAIASQYAESGYIADAPIIDTVGVADSYDTGILMAA